MISISPRARREEVKPDLFYSIQSAPRQLLHRRAEQEDGAAAFSRAEDNSVAAIQTRNKGPELALRSNRAAI